MQPNPAGSVVVPIVIVGGLAVLAVMVFSSKKSTAKTASSGGGGTTPSSGGTAPSTGAPCTIDVQKLHAWGLDHGMVVLYLFTTEAPPSVADLKNAPSWAPVVANVAYNKIVIVTKNGSFWSYDTKGDPVAAPQLKDSYCLGEAIVQKKSATKPGQDKPTTYTYHE